MDKVHGRLLVTFARPSYATVVQLMKRRKAGGRAIHRFEEKDMASPLVSARLAHPSGFASCPSSSTFPSTGAETSSSRVAAPIPQRKTSAASASAAVVSVRRSRNVYGGGGGCVVKDGMYLPRSKFKGDLVSGRVYSSSKTGSRRHGSSSRIPALSSPRFALVQKVNANELDLILSAERTSPMIIDFYATWCGPCVVLAQELEQLAVEYGEDIRFLKVDTDEEHELASQMEIRGLPTMVFVSKDVDKLAIRTEGLLPTDTIRDIIEKEILV